MLVCHETFPLNMKVKTLLIDQHDIMISQLKEDPDARRAILSLINDITIY